MLCYQDCTGMCAWLTGALVALMQHETLRLGRARDDSIEVTMQMHWRQMYCICLDVESAWSGHTGK